MSKAVLISIRPKWCELIASGKKTVEVRKTKPSAILPFKCYIYCTSVKSMNFTDYVHIHTKTNGMVDEWNGRVIGEFVCHNISPLSFYASEASFFDAEPPMEVPGTCLTDKEIVDYLGNGKTGYGWLISDLVIYDKSKELSAFHYCDVCEYGIFCNDDATCKKKLQRPPQSWMYVEELT